jgi:hypothetical protein
VPDGDVAGGAFLSSSQPAARGPIQDPSHPREAVEDPEAARQAGASQPADHQSPPTHQAMARPRPLQGLTTDKVPVSFYQDNIFYLHNFSQRVH